ncbi:MAG: hypothetical protein IH855_07240 [Bacteroidetes bacterium]|nr:hypothetical protein [Bacteroidota bacterium]
MRVNASVLLFTVLFAGTVCRAQHSSGFHNFETINIGLGAVVSIGEAYDGLWSVQPGLEGRIATEFYRGTVHLALGVFNNEDRGGSLPEFLVVQSALGWGYPIAVPAGVTLTGGGHFGATSMLFMEHEQADDSHEIETELAAGMFVRADLPLSHNLGVFVEGDWTHVFTAIPITFTTMQGGIRFTASMPTWLRRVLR